MTGGPSRLIGVRLPHEHFAKLKEIQEYYRAETVSQALRMVIEDWYGEHIVDTREGTR